MTKELKKGHVTGRPNSDPIQIDAWSGDLSEVAGKSVKIQQMLRSGQQQEARQVILQLSVEEQAVIVIISDDPESVLALTGMDKSGKPGYESAVAALLPTETITRLIAPEAGQSMRFNSELIKALPVGAFSRAVVESLDPVYNPKLRTRVSWEWLEAVASLHDVDKAGELLRKVSEGALQEAISDRLNHLNLGDIAAKSDVAELTRAQVFMEGFTGGRPGEYIEDSETAEVLDALYEAAPEFLSEMVQFAVSNG